MLRAAQNDNLSFKRQGMTKRSMPCLFHANLFALDVASCRCQNIGVAGVVVGDVLKRLPNGYCAHVSHDSRLFHVSFSCLCPSSTCGVALVGTSYSTATYGVGGLLVPCISINSTLTKRVLFVLG